MKSFLLKFLVLGAIASGAAVAHSWYWHPRVMLRGESPDAEQSTPLPAGEIKPSTTPSPTGPVNPGPAGTPETPKPPMPADSSKAGSTPPGPASTPTVAAAAPIKDKADISIADAAALHKKEDGLTIFIDAREPHEYTAGHVAGAMSIPASVLRRGRPQKVADNLPDMPVVVVYCGGGDCHASEDVADFLRQWVKSIGSIRIMHAGYPEWTNAGLPTENGPDPFGE